MAGFDYINRAYRLNFSRGTRVEYTGDPQKGPQRGIIVSAAGAYINIRFDGSTKSVGPFHPTWEMRALTPQEAE